MRRSFLLFLLLTLTSCAAAQQGVPLMASALPSEALAHHLGLRSWSFTYDSPADGRLEVRLFHYERGEDGVWTNRFLTAYSVESAPSGRQRITFIIGPAGLSVPYSVGIDDAVFSGVLDGLELESFNVLATTHPGTPLPPLDTSSTYVLMARYPERDGGVTATGNPEDMDAYLALELGQGAP